MKHATILFVSLLIAVSAIEVCAWVDANQFGLGLRVGANRLHGDWPKPKLNPFLVGQLKYCITPYIGLGLEVGYSELKSRENFEDPPELSMLTAADYKTVIIPFEAQATLNFLPIGKVNPHLVLGGGAVLWDAQYQNNTIMRSVGSGTAQQKGLDSFIKIGTGLEFRLSRYMTATVGATYRYSLTDMLDQIHHGDLKDGLVDAYVGLTYYIRTNISNDPDDDGIVNDLDLDSSIPEDADGYMDHDGKPERGPDLRAFEVQGTLDFQESTSVAPVVIHYPIPVAESGKDLKVLAKIYKKGSLRAALVLFRVTGKQDWKSRKLMLVESNDYEAIIPGKYLTNAGLEYCVVAVDEKVTGVGYSGLPNRPIRIKTIKNGDGWRVLSGTMGLIGWGAAAYMLAKEKQD